MRKTVVAVVMFVGVTLSGCADEGEARRCLSSHGYTNVQTTGWAPFSCSEDDTFSTGFVADNPQGQRVEGVVCSNLMLKGCTVRH